MAGESRIRCSPLLCDEKVLLPSYLIYSLPSECGSVVWRPRCIGREELPELYLLGYDDCLAAFYHPLLSYRRDHADIITVFYTEMSVYY